MVTIYWTKDQQTIGKGTTLQNSTSVRAAQSVYVTLTASNRDDFSVKLALLSNEWQGVVRRAQQRRGIIDSLVRQWQNYRDTTEKLQRWLQEVTRDPYVYQPGEPVALLQARTLLDEIQVCAITAVFCFLYYQLDQRKAFF